MKIPILTYHSIDNSNSVISTSPETFRWQMKFLKEADFSVISLETLIDKISKKEPLPTKTVVLTFDDGFQNFYTEAFPVLGEYNFKATVFLVTDFLGKYNDWAGNPHDFPSSKVLSWNEIKELHQYGIRFGGHTRTHPDLTKISDPSLESEIIESKEIIEDLLGRKVTTFAYPFGKFNRTVRQRVEKSYLAACSTNLGKVCPGSDLFSLERVDTFYLSNPKVFHRLTSQTFDGYMFFRQMIRNFKGFVTSH